MAEQRPEASLAQGEAAFHTWRPLAGSDYGPKPAGPIRHGQDFVFARGTPDGNGPMILAKATRLIYKNKTPSFSASLVSPHSS